MALSEDELAVVRSWVGNLPTDDQLDERHDRLGTVEGTILETLRARLASLLDQPANISVPDGPTIGIGENIRSLSDRIQEFVSVGLSPSGEGTTSVYKIYRPQPR